MVAPFPSSAGTTRAGGQDNQFFQSKRAPICSGMSSQQLGRAAHSPCSQGVWVQGWDSPCGENGPLSVTSVRETWFFSPRKSVAKHSAVLRDQQECLSSDPKRSLVFFYAVAFQKNKSSSTGPVQARETTRETFNDNQLVGIARSRRQLSWPPVTHSQQRRERNNPNFKVSACFPKWEYKIHSGNEAVCSWSLLSLDCIVQCRGYESKPHVLLCRTQ